MPNIHALRHINIESISSHYYSIIYLTNSGRFQTMEDWHDKKR
jgi:hypothetical protein